MFVSARARAFWMACARAKTRLCLLTDAKHRVRSTRGARGTASLAKDPASAERTLVRFLRANPKGYTRRVTREGLRAKGYARSLLLPRREALPRATT